MLEDRALAYSRSGTQSCRVQYRRRAAGQYVDCRVGVPATARYIVGFVVTYQSHTALFT